MIRCIAILLSMLFLSGCWNQSPTGGIATSTEGFLSEAERVELHLPAHGKLTLATGADCTNANTLDTEVSKAVGTFLKPKTTQWQIVASRTIGKHILLWIMFPKIADGGVDLIYSIEKKKIVGKFPGGYKG